MVETRRSVKPNPRSGASPMVKMIARTVGVRHDEPVAAAVALLVDQTEVVRVHLGHDEGDVGVHPVG